MSHNLVALRRKHAGPAPLLAQETLLDRLRRTMDEDRVLDHDSVRHAAREAGMPEAIAHGVSTYYGDLSHTPKGRTRVHVCIGTACIASSGLAHVELLETACGVKAGETRADASLSLEPTYCLGLCHAAPSVLVDRFTDDGRHLRRALGPLDEALARAIAAGDVEVLARPEPKPAIASFVEPTIVLRNLVGGADATSLAGARARGAYEALLAAVTEPPARVLDEVVASGQRGRGGAGFPTGQKWRFAAAQPPGEKYVVVNADEGDPGSYIDKVLLERDPHAILEGMALCGFAIGAAHGAIYVRSEYPRAIEALRRAISEARAAGLLAAPIAGTSFSFDAWVIEGAGSYVCGEETALLHSIEGLRGMVTARPPFPAVKGVFERPTVVNNVETLAVIPWIVRHGGAAYAAIGVGKSRGTKAVSLNELFARPGLYEVALGTSLRKICEEIGGGLKDGRAIIGVQVGGPLGGIVPAAALDVPLGFEELDAIGGLLGHAGIVAFAEGTDLRAIARHLFEFGDAESCGKCFPCRIGMRRGLELVDRMVERGGREADLALMSELLETLKHGSLCAHGGGLPAPIESLLTHFRSAMLAPARGSAPTEAP